MHNGTRREQRRLEQKLLPEERQTPVPGPVRGFVVSPGSRRAPAAEPRRRAGHLPPVYGNIKEAARRGAAQRHLTILPFGLDRWSAMLDETSPLEGVTFAVVDVETTGLS